MNPLAAFGTWTMLFAVTNPWRIVTHTSRRKESERMADRFPKDCWQKKCPHFHTRDMSIDDLVCYCDLMAVECDACDADWSLLLCPLPKGE